MKYIENSLVEISLPDFIIRFKDVCLDQLLPFVDMAIDIIQRADNSILIVLLMILFVQLLRLALLQTREGKFEGVAPEQRQLGKEIKDLKKQFKSIQNMLTQLKTIKIGVRQEGAFGNRQAIQQIMNSCRSSLSKREEVSDNILDWQTKIIEEVTKLKKKRVAASRVSVSSKPKQTVNLVVKKNIKSSVSDEEQITKTPFRSQIIQKQKIHHDVKLTIQPPIIKEVTKEQMPIEEEDNAVEIPVVNFPILSVEQVKIQEVVVQQYTISEVYQTHQKVQVLNDTLKTNNQDLIQQTTNEDLIQPPTEIKPKLITSPPIVKPPPKSKMGVLKSDGRKQPPPPPIRRA